MDCISSAVASWHLEAAPVGPNPLAACRGAADLASCRSDLVSLPNSLHGCTMVQSLVSGEELVHRALTVRMTYDVCVWVSVSGREGQCPCLWIMRVVCVWVCVYIFRCSFIVALYL